jgi:hypothetical protein
VRCTSRGYGERLVHEDARIRQRFEVHCTWRPLKNLEHDSVPGRARRSCERRLSAWQLTATVRPFLRTVYWCGARLTFAPKKRTIYTYAYFAAATGVRPNERRSN